MTFEQASLDERKTLIERKKFSKFFEFEKLGGKFYNQETAKKIGRLRHSLLKAYLIVCDL